MGISANTEFSEWAKSYSGCDGGNVSGSIWFCGIEFGGSDTEESLTFEKQENPPYVDESYRDKFKTYQYNWKVLKIYSTLIGDNPSNYKTVYVKSRAFNRDSDVFKINLYPIAFHDENSELWEEMHYQKTGLPTKHQYQAWCQVNRFPVIRSWVQENKPKAIICTGTTYLREFVLAFGGIKHLFQPLNKESLSGGSLLHWTPINQGQTILFITPFLGQGGLKSDAQIESHASKIRDICVKKFGANWCKHF
jgi:hypothetical protein